MAKKGNGNGAAQQAEQPNVEQQPADDGAVSMAPTGDPGETLPDDTAGAAEAPLTSQGEPGPEDFERHSGARLIADHERDLYTLDQVKRRLKGREPVIAARALKSGAKNPIVKIGSRVFTPRKRPEKAGGGIGLAEVGERSEASLD